MLYTHTHPHTYIFKSTQTAKLLKYTNCKSKLRTRGQGRLCGDCRGQGRRVVESERG